MSQRFLCAYFIPLLLALLLSAGPFLCTSQAAEEETISGVVVETIDASDYTYLRIDAGSEEVWAAIPATQMAKGQEVTLGVGMDLRDFYSKTLDRTFERIIFSSGEKGGEKDVAQAASQPAEESSTSFADAVRAEQQQAAPAQPQPAESGGSAGATVPYIDIDIDKAEGDNGYTVAEIFEKAGSLDGETVRVRGKVVKVSPSIMGRNWIHIQDGTGDPMQNSHDLVVTSQELAEVDDIVVVQGVLAANKDFGFGYRYDALVEEATIVQ